MRILINIQNRAWCRFIVNIQTAVKESNSKETKRLISTVHYSEIFMLKSNKSLVPIIT